MIQTQITWPKMNTAFLVIHGVGVHKPFETLDNFTRNFLESFKEKNKTANITRKHGVRRHNDWHNDWIESYIGTEVDGIQGMRRLDFYEYYWDCYMTRDITVRELIKWIDTISNGGEYFYKYEMPDLAKQYGLDEVDSFKGGEFHGYAFLLNRSAIIQLLIRLIAYSPLRFIAERMSLWTALKDLVIYTTSDVRSQNYEIRRKILDGAVEELKLLLKSDYDQIIVVGHSLGSVIAYDALDRIQHDMNVPGDISPQEARRIKGLVTLGSPLDKIAFLFSEPRRRDKTIQRAILAHLHSFRRRKLKIDEDYKDIKNPFPKKLGTRWLNFYHNKDVLGGHLDAYYLGRKDNVKCTGQVPHIDTHSCYWQLRGEVHDKIIQCFF